MKQIKYVENWINNRPMKVLNYLTPNEMFQHLYSVAIAS
jgi:IS30 family transposase